MESFVVEWIDRGREPQCASDPKFPDGIDVDCSRGASAACLVRLPYPAKRCGAYLIRCVNCHQSLLITTAGRRDDPRTVKIACRGH